MELVCFASASSDGILRSAMSRRPSSDSQPENPSPPQRRMTLHAFVEENHKLLTVLGVFTALTVFAANLPLKSLGSMLSFLFMAMTVILWLEVLERFPSKGAGWRMDWFEILLSFTVLVLAFYWFVDFRRVWDYWLVIPVAAPLLWAASKVMDRFDLFNRVFRAKPDEKRTLRYALWVVFIVGALLAAISIAAVVTPHVDRWLDKVAEGMSKPAP